MDHQDEGKDFAYGSEACAVLSMSPALGLRPGQGSQLD